MLVTISTTAQIYHEDDKEGLRIFLRQPSAVAGKINAEQFGLSLNDTINWKTDEGWVSNICCLNWNDENPKRLIEINYWSYSNLAGTLNASKWTELQMLDCQVNLFCAGWWGNEKIN